MRYKWSGPWGRLAGWQIEKQRGYGEMRSIAKILGVAGTLTLLSMFVAAEEDGSRDVALESQEVIVTSQERTEAGGGLESGTLAKARELTAPLMVAEIRSLLQEEPLYVIPGIPNGSKYPGIVYESLRDSFPAGCAVAAKTYLDDPKGLRSFFEFAQIGSRVAELAEGLREYDTRCFEPISKVPREILQVAGVLSVPSGDGGNRVFCSATIIEKDRILTARHCFFDDEGNEKEETGLGQDGTTFFALAKNGRRSAFTVDALSDNDRRSVQAVPIRTYEDTLVLAIRPPAAAWARPARTPLEMPSGAWLVGSNALVGDVSVATKPMVAVRASGPERGCAMLEETKLGCIYHSCQSAESSSGAGLLDYSVKDGVALVGVHTGVVDRAADECEAPPTEPVNVGARYKWD